MDQELHHRIAAGLSRVGLVMRHHAQSVARGHGLTPLQAQAVAVLVGRVEGLRLGALSSELAVTDATASDAVSTLVSKGLVAKGADPEDQRAVCLALTRRGQRVAEELAIWPDFLRSSVDRLPSSEAAGFLRGLIGIVRNLEREGRIPTSRMCVSCRFFEPNRHTGKKKPHHCGLIDEPIGNTDLRLDCPEFEEGTSTAADRNWSAIADSPTG